MFGLKYITIYLILVFLAAEQLSADNKSTVNPSGKGPAIDKKKRLAIRKQRQRLKAKNDCRKKYAKSIKLATLSLRKEKQSLNKKYLKLFGEKLAKNKEYKKLKSENNKNGEKYVKLSQNEKQKQIAVDKPKLLRMEEIRTNIQKDKELTGVKKRIQEINGNIRNQNTKVLSDDKRCKEILMKLNRK